jgi:hypothetical protein
MPTVKDSQEERLHELVCDGKLDQPTAQKAIASDWVTAYKKYFGAEKHGRSSKHYLSRNDSSAAETFGPTAESVSVG